MFRGRDGSQGGDIAHYAAWPVQVYSKWFRTSNALRRTSICEEEGWPSRWTEALSPWSGKVLRERVEVVILKIAGGTVRELAEDGESRTSEIWEPEDN